MRSVACDLIAEWWLGNAQVGVAALPRYGHPA
jgi:hypothetical protein